MKKPWSPRASDPIDRPGRRARSNTACGWFDCSSVNNRPSMLIIVEARPGQYRAAK